MSKRRNLIAYLISLVFLTAIVITNLSLNPIFIRFFIWISAIGFGIWLTYTSRSQRPLRYHHILLPLAAFIAYRFILTSLAPHPIISFELVLREVFMLFAFAFVFDSLNRAWQPRTWQNALLNFAVIFSLIELGFAFLWYSRWWQITGIPFSSPPFGYRSPGLLLGHPNIMAGFLNLLIPIAVFRLTQEEDRAKRFLWILGLIFFMSALYLTSSRGGWLSGILGIATTLVLIYGPRAFRSLVGKTRQPFRKVIPIKTLLFAVPILLILSLLTLSFFKQASTITTHATTVSGSRSGIWGPVIEIIRVAPFFGHGPGSLAVLFNQQTQVPPGFVTSHAHNLVLQFGAETGILGVGFLLWIIFHLLLSLYRTWKIGSPSTRAQLAAYIGAGAALASHQLVDYFLGSTTYALTALIFMALALHHAPPTERSTIKKRWGMVIPIVMLLFYLAGTSYTSMGAIDYWHGVEAGRQDQWQEAKERICQAYQKRTEISLYGFQCGLAQVQLYHLDGDPKTLQSAITLQTKLLQDDPYWPVHWANLAMLEWTSGETIQAITHMGEALEAAPRNSTFALNLALMEEASENEAQALETYLRALEIDPWIQFGQVFVDSPLAKTALEYWKSDPSQETNISPTLEGWRALVSAQFSQAEAKWTQAVEQNPQDARAHAGLALLHQQQGEDDQAWEHVQIALFIDSSLPEILHTAGSIARQQGRDAEAFNYFQQAFNLIENKSYSYSYYYGAFNRFFLESDLVPQMRRGILTPAMIEDFTLLAQYQEMNGNHPKSIEILKRIEIEAGGTFLPQNNER